MSSVLRTRTITGIIFAAVVISLLVAGSQTASALLIIIALAAAYEYGRIVYGGNSALHWLTMLIGGLAPMAILYYIGYASQGYQMALWLSIIFSVIQIINLYFKSNIIPHKSMGLLVAALYIGLPLALFTLLINHVASYNYLLPLGIIMLIWMSDSMAYVVGSRIGKTKLFPSVSPNKTWEGTLGAGFFTIIFAFILSKISSDYSLVFWLVSGLAVWIFGSYGDLVESKLKRFFQIKDSGKILPGHGGFLDRFDSFIFVLPFVILIYLWLLG